MLKDIQKNRFKIINIINLLYLFYKKNKNKNMYPPKFIKHVYLLAFQKLWINNYYIKNILISIINMKLTFKNWIIINL